MMPRSLALLSWLVTLTAFGSNVQLLSLLPQGAVSTAVQLDPAGNIYLTGYTTEGSQDAFVAKLSADGSKLIYFTPLAGTQQDAATALALGSDGSVYVTGNTQSGDFPVTAGAIQATNPMPGQLQGFFAKLNPAGTIVYGTYITSFFISQMTGIAVAPTGEVFVTGIGPRSDAGLGDASPGFILKFDVALSKIAMTVYGAGGGLIQLDGQGNIYVAGSAQPNAVSVSPGQIITLPTLSTNAYQPTHNTTFCITFGSGPGGVGGSYFCRYQYVAKLSPDGTVLWATYVTGTYGAIARGMAVDTDGNVIVAGTTNSDDYPITAGVFQTAYTAAAAPFPETIPGSTYKDPPPSIGYITKVNSTGTGLLWSTYFGGSTSDKITGLAVAPNGDLIISGRAGSSDLPGLEETPDGCKPSAVQELGFVARVASNARTAGPTQLIAGAPDCTYLNCNVLSDYTNYLASWPVAVGANGSAVTGGTNGAIAAVDFLSTNRVTCVADPADNVQLRSVAPGQLISLFGTDLAPATPFIPASGVASSTDNFGVSFNGTPAPILYSSGQQINVQVPFEITGQSSVQMKIVNKQVPLQLAETRTLGVIERQPSMFLSLPGLTSPLPGYTPCGGTVVIGAAALAINADGSVNDCLHPASAGSTVTLFANGLGQLTPAQATGTIASSPAVTVAPGVTFLDPNRSSLNVVTTTYPGVLNGVEKVQFQVPATSSSTTAYAVTPQLLGTDMRERLALIWVRSK